MSPLGFLFDIVKGLRAFHKETTSAAKGATSYERERENTMSYIVKRTRDGRTSYTGPMRTVTHAQREADAWSGAEFAEGSWHAEVVEYTAQVKSEVRAWEKAKREGAR